MSEPVTKKDLKDATEEMAVVTKKSFDHQDKVNDELKEELIDVKEHLNKLDEKIDGVKERLGKKIDKVGDDVVNKMDNKIKAYIEIRGEELMSIKKEEVQSLKDGQENLKERVAVVERQAGL